MTAANPEFATLPSRQSLLQCQPVRPADHRIAIGRHDAASDQVFQMRQHGIAGRVHQAGIDADIDRAHHGGDIGLALGEPMQDRGFARLAVPDQETHIARPFRNFRAMAGEIQILLARGEPVQ